jgi:hypothetical protein
VVDAGAGGEHGRRPGSRRGKEEGQVSDGQHELDCSVQAVTAVHGISVKKKRLVK